ncbi:hypothetical protein QD357_01945 [Rhizobium sp. BR 317]|uniref:hypothetical protein n=1 Tax=Rhizobium sp. BR 317 TaxID=3040015 RepID=UPI0039BF98DD
MRDRAATIDLINELLTKLRLVELAAGSLEDRDDRNALQHGIGSALESANLVKTMLQGEAQD